MTQWSDRLPDRSAVGITSAIVDRFTASRDTKLVAVEQVDLLGSDGVVAPGGQWDSIRDGNGIDETHHHFRITLYKSQGCGRELFTTQGGRNHHSITMVKTKGRSSVGEDVGSASEG